MITIKGTKYAIAGHYLSIKLKSGKVIKSNNVTFPDELIEEIKELPIDIDNAYINKQGLVIPYFKTIPLNVGNISKNWFKPAIIKWYYSDDDQIAIILNNVGGDAEDKQAYKDMQTLRKSASKFAELLVDKTKQLMIQMHEKRKAELEAQQAEFNNKNIADLQEDNTDAEV